METPKIIRGATPKHPKYFRLPKGSTTDPWFDCNRSFWNERILPTARNNFRPEVESLVVSRPGAKRGVRLVIFSSAELYFKKLREEQLGRQAA
jgi:hypothetical protein